MAMLTEDRKGSGIFPILGVGENTYIAVYKRLAKFLGFINLKKCVQLAREHQAAGHQDPQHQNPHQQPFGRQQ